MSLGDVRALTFDTGVTILDWHTGFRDAFAAAGRKHGVERDWPAIANEVRRRSLKAMLNLGEHEPPAHTFDDAHRSAVEALRVSLDRPEPPPGVLSHHTSIAARGASLSSWCATP